MFKAPLSETEKFLENLVNPERPLEHESGSKDFLVGFKCMKPRRTGEAGRLFPWDKVTNAVLFLRGTWDNTAESCSPWMSA